MDLETWNGCSMFVCMGLEEFLGILTRAIL